MRKEDIVVSLGLAKALKEAGVKSPSLFYWRIWDDGSVDCAIVDEDDFDYRGTGNKVIEKIAAYMPPELMEMLPHSTRLREGQQCILSVHKSHLSDGYVARYQRYHNGEIEVLQEFGDRKLADALAKMLIWLREKENKDGMRR
ncbi:MAG: hypothetical protein N2V75_11155 [Methanophagales archaeon]|nr:hypothetical protein [Methanophagales archaeon]